MESPAVAWHPLRVIGETEIDAALGSGAHFFGELDQLLDDFLRGNRAVVMGVGVFPKSDGSHLWSDGRRLSEYPTWSPLGRTRGLFSLANARYDGEEENSVRSFSFWEFST